MLINCVAYQNGRKLADIQVSEIHLYIHEPDCFVWVALADPEPAELESMQKEFGLHELAVEDAQHGHQRPKIEEYGDSLFVVLQVIEPSNGDLNVGEMAIFVGKNYILSVRSRAKRGFIDVRERCEKEPELLRHGPGYVLYALMDAVVDRYFPILDSLETQLEGVEERIFAKQPTRTNLAGCDQWTFSMFQRTPTNNWTFYPASDKSLCKLIQMSWKCSRTILGKKINTEEVMTAEVVLRNKQ